MRKILFIVAFLILVYRISSFGTNLFYADFTLTNKEYGSGAQFPCKVWFNGNTKQMRVDYFSPNGTKFMSQYFNYQTLDKYQVCSDGKCTRATWTSAMPIFLGDTSTYTQLGSCENPDYPGPKACNNYPACVSFKAQPAQPQGIYSLSYFDTTNYKLCLVRWTPATGFTYGPEWHITNYVTSGFTTAQDPNLASTYQSVIDAAGGTCPQPTCFAELDISLVIDESGSIFSASAWNDVQSFVKNLIGAMDIRTDGSGVRIALTYFSGLDYCNLNWSVSSGSFPCPGGINDCGKCGGRWQQLTTGVISDKALLIKQVNSNTGAKGYTCISCGIDVGIKQLNTNQKGNIQKLIILFTDGAQNRVTDTLALQGKIAYDQGIKIIAIGSGAYKIEDLQQFATTIYSTSKFSELTGIINQIITPLCQPLPNVDTCDFCSGLCSCSTTCNCPTCNDYNACTIDKCDPRQPPDGTAGLCVPIDVICNDNNPCTVDRCLNATGCDYSLPTPLPSNLTNTFCKRYNCSNPQGFQISDVGSTVCPPSADKCIINYCNTTVGTTLVNGVNLQGSCVTINRTSPAYPSGTVINYVNSLGQNLTTSGCGRPSNAVNCQVYSCNSTDGSCIINNLGCVCLKNTDCDDGDGCTIDVCDTNLNKCNYTNVDCWANLSGNNCKSGVTTTLSTATGDLFYSGVGSFPLDANGLPPGNVSRSCDLLACYNGQKSSYTCKSQNNATYVCQRQAISCQSAACSDNSCRSYGNWTLGQMNTDCGKATARTCNDNNLCTSDVCNTTWIGTSCFTNGSCISTTGGNRCIFNSNATNCNDGSVCTTDTCNSGTGCVYTSKPLPPTNNCFNVGCNPTTGNFSNVNPSACPGTPANKCIVTYCNTTSGTCFSYDRAVLTQTQTITFVDAYGQTISVTGCNSTDACRRFGCDSVTGLCTIDSSLCACNVTNDVRCDDNNGCTIDSCNVTSGQCQYKLVDCYDELSNSGCKTNQGGIGVVNTEGLANYAAGSPDNPFVAAQAPATYTCDKLACYSGIRSTYTCQNVSNSAHTCVRTKAPCPKGGCLDTICTTLGTWTNGQLNSDCSTTNTPTCTSNACNIAQCNQSFVYGSGNSRCIFTSNASNCDDNNACTQNLCNNATGCDYSQPVTTTFVNTTCTLYTCNPASGWQPTDRGISQCTNLPANPCQVTYCNTTSNTCIRLDRNDIPVGTSEVYIDSAGITQSLSGCKNPGDPLLCKSYSCDTNTGQCQTSTAACKCINDASCSDGDGCTVDVCDIRLNQCNRTKIDCFSILSNGSCTSNVNFAADKFTGINIYYGNVSNPNNFTQVDANGLPFPSTGVQRTCGQLGCYNGQPSQYTCFSVTEGSYTCQRVYVNCSRNGCQDNICRTLGNWTTDGQINSDCGTIYQPVCSDNDACTNDFCNTNWKPTDPVAQRCLHTPINATQFCSDGNFCTDDYCDNQDTTGNVCKHRLYDTSYIKKNLCKNATSVCQTVKCTVNKCVYGEVTCLPPTLCIAFLCNATTKGVCKQFPTGLFKIDKCGVCAGNGLSCVPSVPGNPKKTSIAVALGVGLGVGLAAAAIIIFILSKKSYDHYNALATETTGSTTIAPTYQDGGNYINTTDYTTN